MKDAFTCPMHPSVQNLGPGACPLCGMDLEPLIPSSASGEDAEQRDMQRRFWICLILAVPLVAVAMLSMWPARHFVPGIFSARASALLQWALATPVVLWGGWRFFQRALPHPNMFTLISLGTLAAYGFSTFAALLPDWIPTAMRLHDGQAPLYFEVAASITVLVLLGQVLELGARRKTSGAIRVLLDLSPKTALRVNTQGQEETIPAQNIQPGDLLRVRPGERLPADGVVLSGDSYVDETMITGEPVAMHKGPGEKVVGGTLNQRGTLIIQAENVGEASVLGQIVGLVSEAQRSKAPIQHVADRVSAFFVPAVLLVAALTFVVWASMGPQPKLAHALINAVAVLIIACPCALGLATPVSVTVGIGRGARAGVLIRRAEMLELLEKVSTVAVDKTGTLTEGKPQIVQILAQPGWDAKEVLRLAYAVERASEHPIAAAIVAKAQETGVETQTMTPPAQDFQAFPGKGVIGTVEGKKIRVGSRQFVEESGARVGVLNLTSTCVFLTVGNQFAGAFEIADPIKPSTPQAVLALHQAGIRIVMLTGDNTTAAKTVAEKLGIVEFHAQLLPAQKAEHVQGLKQRGAVVVVAGDGINDAPALAAAHVGMAMSHGTDIAKETAGITLLHGDLRGIQRALRLGKATLRNIRQNLFLAFFYNALAIPLAAGVLYPISGILLSPVLAAAAMSASSLGVVANALRLRNVDL